MHPFAVAYRPGMASQQGIARYLPVELTMVNDLPVMLTDRGRIPYGQPPNDMLLYLLDDNAWPPDAEQGIWIRGAARADIIVRSSERPRRVMVTMRSLTETPVRVSAGGSKRTIDVRPGEIATLMLSIKRSVFTRDAYSYVLSIAPELGTEPSLVEKGSTDTRFLGVQVRLTPVYDRPDAAPSGR
jgi:hypothetical protein